MVSIRDKKGSVYLVILMIILVLGLIGGAGFVTAYSNLTLHNLFFGSNNLFYKTDSLMSQAQIVLEGVAYNAQGHAKEITEQEKSTIIEDATEYDAERDMYFTDMARVRSELERVYKEAFFDYICNEVLKDGTDSNGYKTIQDMVGEDEEARKNGINSVELPTYDVAINDDANKDKGVEVTVVANSNSNNRNKRITAKFLLQKAPSQLSVKKVVAKERNPLWMRAVTTEGDLVAVDGDVTIGNADGNLLRQTVYAWGTNNYRTSGTNAFGNEYGGILAGITTKQGKTDGIDRIAENLNLDDILDQDKDGDITINGRVATDSYIHTFMSGSSININLQENANEFVDIQNSDRRSAVYCESIQNEQVDGITNNIGSKINITGDVATYDDLEVHYTGVGGGIKIDKGSYFGISSGSNYGGKFANSSSSIIYNDDINPQENRPYIYIGKYLFVGGVAYNSDVYNYLYPKELYKTGESIGLGDNHKVYRYPINDDLSNFDNNYRFKIGATPSPNDPEYSLFSGADNRQDHNNVGFKRIERFIDYLIEYYKKQYYSNSSADTQNTMNVAGYNYNELAYDFLPNLGADIQIGGDMIGDDNYKVKGYAKGVVPNKNTLYVPRLTDKQKQDIQAFNLSNAIKQIEGGYETSKFTDLQNVFKANYCLSTYIDQDINKSNRITQRKTNSEFSELTNGNNSINIDRTDGNMILKANTTGGDVLVDLNTINGKSGLILSQGRVIVTGTGTFKGAIVSKGSVVFMDSGSKTILYDEMAVRNAINNNNLDVNGEVKGEVKVYLSNGGINEDIPSSIDIVLKAEKNVKIMDYREEAE